MNNHLTNAQREAIADADAHVTNAGLPSYSQLRQSLGAVLNASRGTSGRLILEASDEAAIRRAMGFLANQSEADAHWTRSMPFHVHP